MNSSYSLQMESIIRAVMRSLDILLRIVFKSSPCTVLSGNICVHVTISMYIEGRIIYQEHEVKSASQQIFQGRPENKQIIACSFVGFFNELFIGALYCDLFSS